MRQIKYLSLICCFVLSFESAKAQTTFFNEKQGTYSYKNNINSREIDFITFGKNVNTLADYFHRHIPLLKAGKGFDLSATLTGFWDDEYKACKWNYGLRGELTFDFQLFVKENGKEGKWTVEPPHWQVDINNTEEGHGGMLKESAEGSLLKELFVVFPLVKRIAPGVDYYNCDARTCGSLVVFNPDRSKYWLPVTVRDVIQAKLEACNDDKFMMDFIKQQATKMSEEELNAPAFNESEDGILHVNGRGEGLQYMRFNPAYWDKTLPVSAIQFLTIQYNEPGYACFNTNDQKMTDEESLKNNSHIDYASEVLKSFNFDDLAKLIDKH
jgi:hypothetical protein